MFYFLINFGFLKINKRLNFNKIIYLNLYKFNYFNINNLLSEFIKIK